MLCKGFIHFSSLNIVWGYIFCRIRISNQISALQIISSFTEHSDVPREALLSSLQLEPEVRSWIFNKFFGLTPIFYIFCWNLIASRISNQSRLEFHREPGLAHGSFWLWSTTSHRAMPSILCGNSLTIPRSRKLSPSLALQCSKIQYWHDVLRWSNNNRYKLNSLKCKELRIDFRRENNLDTVSLEANGNAFEIVKSAKILGVTVRNDLEWIDHVDDITMKASRRIYLRNLSALA